MTDKINNAIGNQLKLARTKKAWSLDTASRHTGVSKAMLGQIERGESSPTIAKLWKVANGFQLPLSYFLGIIGKSDLNQGLLKTEKGIAISTLFPFDEVTKIEVFSLTLSPLHQQMSSPHNTGVIEHILVIEGDMEYFLDNKWHAIQKGDTVRFCANVAHGYRNLTDKPATFHNIIAYSDELKT
jgi:transcriptional regulator with XRE-family HTH domain|tara:strand:- start:1296 stop:1847 length:552 start_codon:yes stop_codon:yes gene_type:complete